MKCQFENSLSQSEIVFLARSEKIYFEKNILNCEEKLELRKIYFLFNQDFFQ